jgi:hypothetical protein
MDSGDRTAKLTIWEILLKPLNVKNIHFWSDTLFPDHKKLIKKKTHTNAVLKIAVHSEHRLE